MWQNLIQSYQLLENCFTGGICYEVVYIHHPGDQIEYTAYLMLIVKVAGKENLRHNVVI